MSLFLQICKVQSRHGLPILEQSKAPTCTPLAMSHPPLKSLPLGVRWILVFIFVFFNNSLWCYNILCFDFSLTIAHEVKIWTNDTHKKSAVLVNCRLPLHPLVAGSSAVEVASPMELCWGTALCRVWQAQPAPCFVDLQKAWGKVANDVNAFKSLFSQVGMAWGHFKFWRCLGSGVPLQITLF